MQLYDPKRMTAPASGVFNPKEKRRLMLLGVAAVVLFGAVVAVRSQAAKREAQRLAELEMQRPEAITTELVAPKIDVAALEAAASDERPEQRVVLPGGVLEVGFAQSAQVYDGVFDVLGGSNLDGETAARIVAAPKEFRGKLYRTRCRVEELRTLPGDADAPSYIGRGRLEGEATVFFAAERAIGLVPVPGDWIRIDGLFARAHREEVDGEWREGPLLIGPRMYESYRRLEPVLELTDKTFAFVRDDSVAAGFDGLNSDAYWDLVSYVKHLDATKIDWEAAPILDNPTISQIFTDGTPWRGRPVRVPVARLLGAWDQVQPENPLRVEHMVEGWFGRGDWLGQAKVARFVAPFDAVPPNLGKDITARAFFYKNLAYTPKNGGIAIAPFFVVHSIEPFIVPKPIGLQQMAYVLTGTLIVIGAFGYWLMRRDRKSSEALEAELIRRRRARREKLAAAPRA